MTKSLCVIASVFREAIPNAIYRLCYRIRGPRPGWRNAHGQIEHTKVVGAWQVSGQTKPFYFDHSGNGNHLIASTEPEIPSDLEKELEANY